MNGQMTQRVRIPTGLDCNENCRFCYFHDELNTRRYTTAQMYQKLEYAYAHGIRDIDFSGGEPTLRQDLIALIARARSMGFRKICIITNGTKTKERTYFSELVDAGLNEILLSIHGYDDVTHSAAVQRKNSWQNIEKTVELARGYKVRLRTNTVVTTLNMEILDKIAQYLYQVNPVAVNFICFNDWIRAASLTNELACKYSQARKYLCKSIDILRARISKISVRYIPFCFMQGYEQYVCDILQNEEDSDEWIDPIKKVLTYDDVEGEAARQYTHSLYKDFQCYRQEVLRGITTQYTEAELSNERLFEGLPCAYLQIAHRADRARVRNTYVKGAQCDKCSRKLICDGLEKSYAQVIGTDELQAVKGTVVTDPLFFRREYSRGWI